MAITKKYLAEQFDKQFQLLKAYIDGQFTGRLAEFEKKMDEKFARQTEELKKFTESEVDFLAALIQEGVIEPLEAQIYQVDRKFDKVSEVLGISFDE